MKLLFLTCFLFFSGVSQAQALKITGRVYLDENENGIRDASEKPLKNVLVSNGKTITKTNKNGKYSLVAETGNSIFPILPPDYSFGNKNYWWYTVRPESFKRSEEINFGLLPSPSGNTFKALVIGDIQVGDLEELAYADQSILPELRKRNDYDFSIFMGDLVNDEPDLFSPLKERIKDMQKPSWIVYGNHDKNSEKIHQLQHLDFTESFGPTTFAFNHGKVLFIVLNSIEPVGKFGYNEKYGLSDLHFLAELLKEIDKDQFLVISQHVPLGMMENKQALLDQLKDREKVLLLSGHTHTVFQNFREREDGHHIHELTAGAVSGHWWTGEKDWQGVPLALMQCGTPRGYFELDFFQGPEEINYQIRYKGVGLPEEKQLSIWFGEQGKEIRRVLTPENPGILVNIFAGSEKTEVRMRVGEGDWQPMERKRIIDPFIARIKELQEEKLYPNSVSRRSPYLSRPSSHIWEAYVPSEMEEGYHKLEILATDAFGLDHRETAWFLFQKEEN